MTTKWTLPPLFQSLEQGSDTLHRKGRDTACPGSHVKCQPKKHKSVCKYTSRIIADQSQH